MGGGNITWLQTVNRTRLYHVETNGRVSLSTNGSVLSFSPLQLYDEEYYACGLWDEFDNSFTLLDAFEVYVEVLPVMALLVDNTLVAANDTIALVPSANVTYTIACASINSRPDVKLFVFDTESQVQLTSSGNEYRETKKCDDVLGVCSNLIEIFVRFDSSSSNSSAASFDLTSSLSCTAVSTNPNVSMYQTITRNVSIFNQSGMY